MRKRTRGYGSAVVTRMCWGLCVDVSPVEGSYDINIVLSKQTRTYGERYGIGVRNLTNAVVHKSVPNLQAFASLNNKFDIIDVFEIRTWLSNVHMTIFRPCMRMQRQRADGPSQLGHQPIHI